MKFSSILFTAGFFLSTVAPAMAATDSLRGQAERHLLDEVVPNEYIVVLKDGSTVSSVANMLVSVGGTILKEYSHVLNGFAATLPAALVPLLAAAPEVDYIEPNFVAAVSAEQTNNLPWGLDRIDQTTGTDGSYTFEETGGSGVHAYVIDTGVTSTHSDFTGRLGNGFNARQGDNQSPQAWDDCQGHGTHVASTVGGTKYGVAKAVTIHGVRVLSCSGSGSFSDVLEGMDWVAGQHSSNPGQKSVANMSLGGGRSNSINSAVQRMVEVGIVVAVAAGNDNGDACNVSPASAVDAITVGATTQSDARASYSNWGSCVDIMAPGSSIIGAWFNCDTCSRTLSGTSMASPHVAGVAALFLEKSASNATPNQIMAAVLNRAATGLVSDTRGSPNELLQSTTAPGGTPTTPPAPTFAPTQSPTPFPTNTPPSPTPTCVAQGQVCGGLFFRGEDCCPGLRCSGLFTARCNF
jgi:subtilisin family serine protease